jgi:hypothetical protein
MRRPLIFAAALFITSLIRAESERDIQQRIDAAIRAGGGEVIIPAGVHRLERGLMLKDAKHVRLASAEPGKAILELGPLTFAEVSTSATAGASAIEVKNARNLILGMRLKIEADAEPDAFTGKPRPYVLAMLKAVNGSQLVLEAPLKFPVPAGTFIRHEDAPNLITVRGASEDVRIEGLVLDGGRRAGDPPVRGHTQLCGIFATGQYSYEKGPADPRVKGLHIAGCMIRNCFGRGIAFYAVQTSTIEDCVITGTNDEAIDLDHFTVQAIVRRNRAEECNVGVELNDANDCVVEENEFRGCGIGLNLWRWCKQPGLNEHNRIARNAFIASRGNGIQIATGTAANELIDNRITGAARNGISLAGAGQTVTGNRNSDVKLKPIVINEGEHTLRDNE